MALKFITKFQRIIIFWQFFLILLHMLWNIQLFTFWVCITKPSINHRPCISNYIISTHKISCCLLSSKFTRYFRSQMLRQFFACSMSLKVIIERHTQESQGEEQNNNTFRLIIMMSSSWVYLIFRTYYQRLVSARWHIHTNISWRQARKAKNIQKSSSSCFVDV